MLRIVLLLSLLLHGAGALANEAQIRRTLEPKLGGAKIEGVQPAPIPGLFEVRYRGRQPAEIRFTRFNVVPRGNGYGFTVLAQEPLR